MNLIDLRASAIAELFDCPARWEAKHVLGMQTTSSGPARLGTAWHEASAVYDIARMAGNDDVANVETALAVFEEVLFSEREQPVVWEDDERREALSAGHWLVTEYIHNWAHKINYLEIEKRYPSIDLPEIGIRLTGTTDAVVKDSMGRNAIMDRKSGKTAVSAMGGVNWEKHVYQLGSYEILASQSINIDGPPMVLGGQVAKTDKGRRMALVQLPQSPRGIMLGSDEQPGVLHAAAKILKSGDFHGNPNSQLCSGKYCPRHATCRFKL
jgi:hypothetical protein